MLSLNQEGLESELLFNGNNQVFGLFTNISKSKKTNGAAQSRRPALSYGGNYSQKFETSKYGPFDLNITYKYTGTFMDWDGSATTKQKSTDLVDLSIRKNWFGNTISLNISNLLNERYEKPATYSQDGRQLRFGFKRTY